MPAPKIPSTILEQRGSRHAKKRQGEIQPAVPLEAPGPPPFLSDRGKEVWADFSKELHAAGLLSTIDTFTAGLVLERCLEYISFKEIIARDGAVINTPDGPKRHPVSMMANAAWNDALRGLKEFGASPVSRIGLVALKPTTGNLHPDGRPKTKFAKG